jgi:D-inositol-3-phosphate glycosyltransferase
MVSAQASPLATDGPGISRGVHVAEAARALAQRGHEVCVYTRRTDPDLPGVLALTDDVRVEHVPAGPAQPVPPNELLPHLGEFGRWLAARWAEEPAAAPDVVHAHYWMSGLAALTATATNQIPLVVTYHGLGAVQRRAYGAADPSPDTRAGLERELGQRADRILAQSGDEIDELSRMGVPRGAIMLAPSGVNTEVFRPDGPVVSRPARGRHRILTVGRMVETSGFGDLVVALSVLPDAELLVVGGPVDGGPEAARLRELAERRGVADRLHLVGAVPNADLADYYRSADVVACASWYDAVGLSALEAMACGVPVVAYEVGGLAESVIDGVTGTLVAPRDVRGLAGAIRAVLGDEVRRMSYASAAVDRVRSRYAWDRAAADIERAYLAVTGEPVPAAGALSEVGP